MNASLGYVILLLVSSVSRVVLKISAKQENENKLKKYLNPRVLFSYAIFFGATRLTTIAYRGVPLSLGSVLEATGYVYITILGKLVLKENFTVKSDR